jgi:hypothetical protein
MADVQQKIALTCEQSDETLQRFTDRFIFSLRAPVLHWPSHVGLEYEDVTFPSRDGVPVEGWFIPAPGSTTLIIANPPPSSAGLGYPPTLSPGMRSGRPAATGSR